MSEHDTANRRAIPTVVIVIAIGSVAYLHWRAFIQGRARGWALVVFLDVLLAIIFGMGLTLGGGDRL